MGNVKIQSGVVTCILGDSTGNATGKTYTGVAANVIGPVKYKDSPYATYQAVVTGTGAITATVNILVSNDGVNFNNTVAGTLTLTGNDTVSDGFATSASWKFVRAVLSNLTGTNARCYVLQGV